MKQLILGRHSFTESPNYDKDDLKRKLTDQGIYIAKQQANKLIDYKYNINQIITSHAVRAKQTTKIYQDILKVKLSPIEASFLYHDYTTQDFLSLIAEQNNNLSSLLIVAHNPTLSETAYRLCSDYNEGMQPATFVVLNFDVDSWKEIEVYKGQLMNTIRP